MFFQEISQSKSLGEEDIYFGYSEEFFSNNFLVLDFGQKFRGIRYIFESFFFSNLVFMQYLWVFVLVEVVSN